MTAIYGILGINDTERVFLSTLGQRVVYDAVQEVARIHNEEMRAALSNFVDQTTTDYKLRYLLPGGGRLQERGGLAQSAAVKRVGRWNVAFPLKEFGDQIAGSRVDWAYMTVQDLDKHLETVFIQNMNTVRFELLKALLNNSQWTFADPLWGDLTIEPLANGDSVLYPPVLGSETEATEDHYLESGYLASAISDANDPVETIINELEEHFGAVSGNSDVVVFCNNAQTGQLQALTDFVAVTDSRVIPGDDTAVVVNALPDVPGRIIGRHNSGAWISEWRWIPANYLMGLHLNAPRPLYQRVDPDYTGLPRGLTLVAESDVYPFTQSHWEHRFGLAVANRLNGVVVELGTGGGYTVPTAYS